MLFRFLIIVSLLSASDDPWTKHMIPADIGTRVVSRTRGCIIGQDNCFLRTEQCKGPEDCGLDGIHPPMIPWKKVITYIVVFTIIIFLLATFIGVICNTIRRYLMKDKSRRSDEDKETSDKPIVHGIPSPMIPWMKVIYIVAFITIITFIFAPGILLDAICETICRNLIKDKFRRNDEDIETSDKPIGKQENKLIIGNGEAARGPMAEKSDYLQNTEINKQWIGDKIAKFEARQKVIIHSDRKHENRLIIGNGEAAHRPMAEKSDNLKNSKVNKKWLHEKIAKFEARQNVIINSDRKHENKLITGIGEAARGPMAEKINNLQNTEINKQWIRDKIAKFEAHQKVIIDSDKPQPVSRIAPQVSDICADCKTCLSQNLQLGRAMSRCEPTINMGSSQRRLYLSKKSQIPGSVSVLPSE